MVIPRRGRQRRMSRFSPQPEGTGPIFPISASIVVSRHPVCVTPHSLNSKKSAPVAAIPVVLTDPSSFAVWPTDLSPSRFVLHRAAPFFAFVARRGPARTPPHSNTFLSSTTGHSTQKSMTGRTTEIVRAVFADNFALSAHNRKWTDRNSSGLHSQATEKEQCAPTAAVTTASEARKRAQKCTDFRHP